MLKIVLIAAGTFVGLIVLAAAWLYLRAVAGLRRTYAELARRIEPVTQALDRGETPSTTHLMRFAEDRETRKVLYDALDAANKSDLFPAQFRTWELMAEAHLVAWLCHPNELASPPAEIELVARVPAPDAESDDSVYFVFRYRTFDPHWAAKDGWLAGVVGPCATNSDPVPYAMGTLSQFESIDARTPADHVARAHAAVFGARPVDLPKAS
jgi:hypothetical protein